MWNKTGHILSTIFWGIFLAYLIDPLSSWFQNLYETRVPFLKKSKKGSRIFAVLSSLFFFLSLVTLGVTLFSMNVFSYFQEVSWEDFTEKINHVFHPMIQLFTKIEQNEPFSRYQIILFDAIEKKVSSFMKHFMELILSFPDHFGRFFLGIILALYFLFDKESFLVYAKKMEKKLIRKEYQQRIQIAGQEFLRIFSGYLKGQAFDALLMGCLLSFGLWVIQVPLGISIGILAGIGNLVPYLGPFLAYAFTIFFCLLEGKKKTLWISLLYLLLIQQLDGSFIGPRLLGSKIQLKPVFILLAVWTGGTFFGPFGMVFAVPFAGWIKSIYEMRKEEENERNHHRVVKKKTGKSV